MSSPLPSLCFFSPCDHICICLRAEAIEIYGLETDKDELLRSCTPPLFALSVHSYSLFECRSVPGCINHLKSQMKAKIKPVRLSPYRSV